MRDALPGGARPKQLYDNPYQFRELLEAYADANFWPQQVGTIIGGVFRRPWPYTPYERRTVAWLAESRTSRIFDPGGGFLYRFMEAEPLHIKALAIHETSRVVTSDLISWVGLVRGAKTSRVGKIRQCARLALAERTVHASTCMLRCIQFS
jgi:hypothetical protein